MDVDLVREMYNTDHKSAREVADHYGKTVWQVYKFMKKHGVVRRTAAQTIRLKFLKSPLSFTVKNDLTQEGKRLRLAGLMLYWAEGSKANKHTVDFTNSDEMMIVIFLKMMRKVYGVNRLRIRVLLYCYSNQDITKLVDYWSAKLQIPKEQFTKPYVRQDFDPEKTEKMAHGLVHIRYSDMRLLEKIKQDIGKISHELGRDGGVVKHTSL